ncbi:MAG TPA: class I SAM-dependent methyltransferase [Phycicoccus sp.]|nr:class I SAM-dependent methyltransferase [Phycicoccus sp.]
MPTTDPTLPTPPVDHLAVNRANWDERAPAHAASPDYAVERLVADPTHLSDVVRFDLPRLGDVAGLRGLHLQCHIGTDTLSLARLGARMTGLDLSPASLEEARRLAERTGTAIDFVEADVAAAPDALAGRTFDLLYTGIGALCWLPDIDRWAEVVATLLAPAGRLFLREGHPMLWAMDEAGDGPLTVRYPYFETPEGLEEEFEGTYVETSAAFTANRTISWNHGLGEVVGALLAHGLVLTDLVEHRSVPWDALPGRMARGEDGEYRLLEHPERLPLTYTLQARLAG